MLKNLPCFFFVVCKNQNIIFLNGIIEYSDQLFLNVSLLLSFKVVVDAGLVDPSHQASDSVVSLRWDGHDQRGVFRELLRSPACMNSDEAGSSGVKLSEEGEGFDSDGGDA